MIIHSSLTGEFHTQTLKCTQFSTRGVKAESIYEYTRSREKVGATYVSICTINESIIVDGDLNLGTRTIAEIDCDWTPSCYTKGSGKRFNQRKRSFE